MQRCHPILTLSLPQKQHAQLGLANPRGVLQNSLEYRTKFARRTANDLEHLGGRGLLLSRLSQFAGKERDLL